MSERVEPTMIEMSPETASALRARGGVLYVWKDKAAMIRARPKPPAEALAYETFVGDGWTVRIADGITSTPVQHWLILWKRLPWPHFRAFDDPVAPEPRSLIEAILDAGSLSEPPS